MFWLSAGFPPPTAPFLAQRCETGCVWWIQGVSPWPEDFFKSQAAKFAENILEKSLNHIEFHHYLTQLWSTMMGIRGEMVSFISFLPKSTLLGITVGIVCCLCDGCHKWHHSASDPLLSYSLQQPHNFPHLGLFHGGRENRVAIIWRCSILTSFASELWCIVIVQFNMMHRCIVGEHKDWDGDDLND